MQSQASDNGETKDELSDKDGMSHGMKDEEINEVDAIVANLSEVILEQPTVPSEPAVEIGEVIGAVGGADGGCLVKPQSNSRPHRVGGTIAEGGDHMYRVKTSFELKEGRHIYKMSSKVRGYCVIVNNYEFVPDYVLPRHGSISEAEYLMTIFEQLGYLVVHHENLSALKMLNTFLDLSKDEKLREHDSLIVWILTHGDRGLLMGSDGDFAAVETIVGMFNNHHCSALIHKPKIFFIQACRGNALDYGVIDPASAADAVPRPSPVVDSIVPILPSTTDTLICYSTVEGYISLRNEHTGSWFGDAIGRILIDHACEDDLETLLKRVNNRMMRRESLTDDRLKQAVEIVLRGWCKQFYFNPGIYSA